MSKHLLNKEEFLAALATAVSRLGIVQDEIIIMAGGAMLLMGLREQTGDIDCYLSPQAYSRLPLEFTGEGIEDPSKMISICIDDFVIEVSRADDFDRQRKLAQNTNGYYHDSALTVLELKERLNREKDQRDIVLLKAYIQKGQEFCEKSLVVEVDESHTCADCEKSVPLKDGVLWKWYNFCAPRGDVPLFLCSECRKLEKHRERLARDARNFEWAFGADWE